MEEMLMERCPGEPNLLKTFRFKIPPFPHADINCEHAQTVHFQGSQNLRTKIHWEKSGSCHTWDHVILDPRVVFPKNYLQEREGKALIFCDF